MHDSTHDRAARFRALHAGPALLVLPNAWDAASARVVEKAGAAAIATSSAAVAWTRGYPDGQALPLAAPPPPPAPPPRPAPPRVSADIASAYATDAATAAATVA